jgi:hypothetical protein
VPSCLQIERARDFWPPLRACRRGPGGPNSEHAFFCGRERFRTYVDAVELAERCTGAQVYKRYSSGQTNCL